MKNTKELIIKLLVYFISFIGAIIFFSIIVFIFSKGYKTLNFNLIFGNYSPEVVNVRVDSIGEDFKIYQDPHIDDSYFSSRWGISLSNTKDIENNTVVKVVYISSNSPLRYAIDYNSLECITINSGLIIEKITMLDNSNNFLYSLQRDGAKEIVDNLNQAVEITDLVGKYNGGGVKGSLIATIQLIILTLIISLPLGISSALFIREYSTKNKIIAVLKSMIDLSSGIPSIIFGLVGAIVFIPMMNRLIGSSGGSIASGALTLTIIVLPIIIKTIEENLNTIPDTYRFAALSLGATRTQMVFKVILPNAISGILTSALLSIGRIVGESAALIYAIGTSIKDNITLNGKGTPLAVHIWCLMSGENPNYEIACSIAIIILIIVFIMNIFIKVISIYMSRRKVVS